MEYLGINGQIIPQMLIPFDDRRDGLVIEGEKTKELLTYSIEHKGWFLVTKDKSKFLSTPHQNFKIVGERLV